MESSRNEDLSPDGEEEIELMPRIDALSTPPSSFEADASSQLEVSRAIDDILSRTSKSGTSRSRRYRNESREFASSGSLRAEDVFRVRYNSFFEFGRFDVDQVEVAFCEDRYGQNFFALKFVLVGAAFVTTLFGVFTDIGWYPKIYPSFLFLVYRCIMRYSALPPAFLCLVVVYLLQPHLTDPEKKIRYSALTRRRLYFVLDLFILFSFQMVLWSTGGMRAVATGTHFNSGGTILVYWICSLFVGRLSLLYFLCSLLGPLIIRIISFQVTVDGFFGPRRLGLSVWIIVFFFFVLSLTAQLVHAERVARRLFVYQKRRETLVEEWGRQEAIQRKTLAAILPAKFIDQMMVTLKADLQKQNSNGGKTSGKKVLGYYQKGVYVVIRTGFIENAKSKRFFPVGSSRVHLFRKCFAAFDAFLETLPSMEKLKSFGSSYLIVEPVLSEGATLRAILTAVKFARIVRAVAGRQIAKCFRVAVVQAPGIVGAIGQNTRRLTFDVWGDVAFLSHHLFEVCSQNCIIVSRSVVTDVSEIGLPFQRQEKGEDGCFELRISKVNRGNYTMPEWTIPTEDLPSLEIKPMIDTGGQFLPQKTTLGEVEARVDDREEFDVDPILCQFRNRRDRWVYGVTTIGYYLKDLSPMLIGEILMIVALTVSSYLYGVSNVSLVIHLCCLGVVTLIAVGILVFGCGMFAKVDAKIKHPEVWRGGVYIVSLVALGMTCYLIPILLYVAFFLSEEDEYLESLSDLYNVLAVFVGIGFTLRPFYERTILLGIQTIAFIACCLLYAVFIQRFYMLFGPSVSFPFVAVASYLTTRSNLTCFKLRKDNEKSFLAIANASERMKSLLRSFVPEQMANEIENELAKNSRLDVVQRIALTQSSSVSALRRSLLHITVGGFEVFGSLRIAGQHSNVDRSLRMLFLLDYFLRSIESIVRSSGMLIVRVVHTTVLVLAKEDQSIGEICEAGFEILDFFSNYKATIVKKKQLEIRLGLHYGTLHRGIVGETKFCSDLFGSDVTRAIACAHRLNALSCSREFLLHGFRQNDGSTLRFIDPSVALVANRLDLAEGLTTFLLLPPNSEVKNTPLITNVNEVLRQEFHPEEEESDDEEEEEEEESDDDDDDDEEEEEEEEGEVDVIEIVEVIVDEDEDEGEENRMDLGEIVCDLDGQTYSSFKEVWKEPEDEDDVLVVTVSLRRTRNLEKVEVL